jgi:hypothetical protein
MIKMSISLVWVVREKKLIGALNSARIGEEAKPENIQFSSSKIGEVWIELEK